METTQTISRKDLKYIHDNVCSGWQTKIKNILSNSEWDDEIYITEDVILQGYSEADIDNKKLIKKYFTIPEKLIDKIKTLNDVWSLLGSSYEDNLIFKSKKLNSFEKHINAEAIIYSVSIFLNQGWSPKFDGSQINCYPSLEYNKKTGRWVCSDFDYDCDGFVGPVSYYKNPETTKKAFELLEEEYNVYLNNY